MIRLLRCEPVMVTSLIKAILVCLVAFGLPLSDGQSAALVGVAGAILALGAAARAAVVPLAKLGGQNGPS